MSVVPSDWKFGWLSRGIRTGRFGPPVGCRGHGHLRARKNVRTPPPGCEHTGEQIRLIRPFQFSSVQFGSGLFGGVCYRRKGAGGGAQGGDWLCVASERPDQQPRLLLQRRVLWLLAPPSCELRAVAWLLIAAARTLIAFLLTPAPLAQPAQTCLCVSQCHLNPMAECSFLGCVGAGRTSFASSWRHPSSASVCCSPLPPPQPLSAHASAAAPLD